MMLGEVEIRPSWFMVRDQGLVCLEGARWAVMHPLAVEQLWHGENLLSRLDAAMRVLRERAESRFDRAIRRLLAPIPEGSAD